MARVIFAVGAIAALLDLIRRMATRWRPTTPRATACSSLVFGLCSVLGGYGVIEGAVYPLAWPVIVLYMRDEPWPTPTEEQKREDEARRPWLREWLVSMLLIYFVGVGLIHDFVVDALGIAGAIGLVTIWALGVWLYRDHFVWVYERVVDP